MNTDLYELPAELKAHWVDAGEVRDIRSLYISGFASGTNPTNAIHRLSPERLQLKLRHGATKLYVVRKRTDTRRGEIVSMATLLIGDTLDGMKGFVHHVATHPDHQGRGLGLAVMKSLLSHADELNLDEVGLTCSHKRAYAWPLYRKLGFEEVTPTYTPAAEGDTVYFKRRRPQALSENSVAAA